MIYGAYADLKIDEKMAVDAALDAREKSQVPYSKVRVGSAVLTKEGKIFAGSKLENSSYGVSYCSEAASILSANSNGFKNYKSLAIVIDINDFPEISEGYKVTETIPCGECRQVISDAAQNQEGDIEIIIATPKKDRVCVSTIDELLKNAFGPKNLQ